VVLLLRYREALSGRVLEVGCGGGRLLGYLLALGGEVHGIDVSDRMVEYCRRSYPQAHVRVGDAAALRASVEGRFSVVFPSFNLLDVFDDAGRRRVLTDIRGLLSPDGLLIFSSHNLAFIEDGQSVEPGGARLRALLSRLNRPPGALARDVGRLPARIRNRRRLAGLQRHEADHAILNDAAFDYSLLHYYIRRDDQARQLAELGYELIECLDLEGRRVEEGGDGEGPELHYVARARKSS
jgi:SAM-dependent methyltransferase